MKRNVARRYAQNHSYHENPAHTLLQGLQNFSDSRGLTLFGCGGGAKWPPEGFF